MVMISCKIIYDKKGKPVSTQVYDNQGKPMIAGGTLNEPKFNFKDKGFDGTQTGSKEIFTFNEHYSKNKGSRKKPKTRNKQLPREVKRDFFDSLMENLKQVERKDEQGVKTLFLNVASTVEKMANKRGASKTKCGQLVGQVINMRIMAGEILKHYDVKIPYNFESETAMREYGEAIISIGAQTEENHSKKSDLIRLGKTLLKFAKIAKDADMKNALDRKE